MTSDDRPGHVPSEEHASEAARVTTPEPRIPSGRLRDLGAVNWVIAKLGARVTRVPELHVFTTLGQHKPLFWGFLLYSGALLAIGKLPKQDTEMVILRVAHLRDCRYELQQHRRIARTRGVDDDKQARIFAGPDSEGLSDRDRALLTGTDELVHTRTLSPETWVWLSRHLNRTQLIEFVTLAGQYDALAATLTALKVPLDLPED